MKDLTIFPLGDCEIVVWGGGRFTGLTGLYGFIGCRAFILNSDKILTKV